MASKTVALAEDAYDLLASQKRPGESFSDVVRRIAGRPNPVDFVGAWAGIPRKDIEGMRRQAAREGALADRKMKRKLDRWGRRWPS